MPRARICRRCGKPRAKRIPPRASASFAVKNPFRLLAESLVFHGGAPVMNSSTLHFNSGGTCTCCGCGCADCASVNYGTFNLAQSGISITTGCVPNATLNDSITPIAWDNPTGFFTTFPNNGNSSSPFGSCCTWQVTFSATLGGFFEYNFIFGNTSCSGSPTTFSTTFSGFLFKVSGSWIYTIIAGPIASFGASSQAVAFFGRIATTSGTNCSNPTLTFTNQITSTGTYVIPSDVPGFGGGQAFAVGTGGTAVFSA